MKPARIIVLVIAVVAGGIAALLAGRSDPPPPAPAPVAQLETTDVLIANSDIGLGNTVSAQDLRWQTVAGSRPPERTSSARATGRTPSSSLPARSRARHSPPASRSAKPS